MGIEQKVKDLIISQYGTMKAFAGAIGMPNSTLDSIFHRGLQNASISNIIKICTALDISADALCADEVIPVIKIAGAPLSADEIELIKKYRTLDERGRVAVLRTADYEFEATYGGERGTISGPMAQ